MSKYVIKYTTDGTNELVEEVHAEYTLSAELKFIDRHMNEDYMLITVEEMYEPKEVSD